MKRTSLWVLISIAVIAAVVFVMRTSGPDEERGVRVNIRLQWIAHAQFAGYIVALRQGYYEQEGLDVDLRPAGPDLKPHQSVANGSDHFGVGVPNQVLLARSNGVPLVVVAQFFQDSPNRYVLKAEDRIEDLRDLRGQPVGLWLGGDEAEFAAMLATVDMKLGDVRVVNQGFTVTPFLQDAYKLSMVTTYNELILVRDEYDGELQVLSPKDYGVAILGDMLFTTEGYMKEHPDVVEKVLRATIRGWRFALEHTEEALDIILAYNPELDRDHQAKTLTAINELITAGNAGAQGIGYLDPAEYETVKRVLGESGQLTRDLDVQRSFDRSAWETIPLELKRP